MFDRYELQLRINQLQVIKWKMVAYPERFHWFIREGAIDWLSMEINELIQDLEAAGYRKAG